MEDKPTRSEEKLVPAVEQASRVLFCLAGHKSSQMGFLEICSKVGLHKSRAHALLKTLQKFGLVQRHSDKKGYSLGPSLITLSRKVLDDFNAPRLAAPLLEELAIRFGGTATLGFIADREVFVVTKHEGVDFGVTIRTGHRFPLTHGAHGKAIAAFLPPTELAHLLGERELFFHGTPEKFDAIRLEEEMARCRCDGFALDLGEMVPSINSVAAPVLGPHETPIGYIALLGLFSAETAVESGPLVAAAGKSLSRQLGARIA